ncbi:tetratricopeptide repeat-containing diguanylate cyclase [Thalassotalea euphylliae]|uniref:diguanylate cyclase n=1 Tax=Thalassotalea euphylliae TaxID=1655234 RepID=A0A3E0UCB0_9GAMM|nr:tetratricopeptide repeat-containing diguanylate cyclase [Thalassotalea euphylliae]REL34651.1 diguanylate cyclase [Thalassotalea euphylliae]
MQKNYLFHFYNQHFNSWLAIRKKPFSSFAKIYSNWLSILAIATGLALASLSTSSFALTLSLAFAPWNTQSADAFEQVSNANISLLEQLAPIRRLSDTEQAKAVHQLQLLKPSLTQYPLNEQLEYYHVLAEVYSLQGQHRLARATAEQGLILASSLISPRIIIAQLAYDLGYALETLGKPEQAMEQYLAGLEVAESLDDQKEIAKGLINIGAIYYQTDKLSEAIIAINDAATIAERLSDLELKGLVYSELGILYDNLKKGEQSREYYQSSYRYYMQAEKPLLAINNLRNIAVSYSRDGDTDQAIKTYLRLLNELAPLNNTEMLFSGHVGLANIYVNKEIKQYDLALEHLAITELLLADVEHHYLPFQFLINKSNILKEMGQYEQALSTIDEAFKLFYSDNINAAPMDEAALLVLRSETYRLMGEFQKAYNTYHRVYELNMAHLESSTAQAEAELRLQYESQRVDIEKSLLESRHRLESLALEDVKETAYYKQLYIYVAALLAIVFAILLNNLMKGQKQLVNASRTDVLTKVLNRSRFIELALKGLKRAKKRREPVAFMLIDCDFFKTINAQYGHRVGDEALILIGQIGQTVFERPNIFARYGGEEFVVLLPGVNLTAAKELAERFRQAVVDANPKLSVETELTVSIGVSTTEAVNSYKLRDLFDYVDNSLHHTKHQGRERICS